MQDETRPVPTAEETSTRDVVQARRRAEMDGAFASFRAQGGRLSETGLAFPRDFDIEDWGDLGRYLGRLDSGIRWWIGDWLLWGQTVYGERYAQMIEATGLAYQTLSNRAWVASRFPPERRRVDLSWSHHHVVAGQTPERGDELLRLAAAEGWSVVQLTAVVKSGDPVAAAQPMGRCPHCRQAVPVHVLAERARELDTGDAGESDAEEETGPD